MLGLLTIYCLLLRHLNLFYQKFLRLVFCLHCFAVADWRLFVDCQTLLLLLERERSHYLFDLLIYLADNGVHFRRAVELIEGDDCLAVLGSYEPYLSIVRWS